MKTDNPLTRAFLVKYPVESARILEQVSAKHVAAFFTELPGDLNVDVISSMLPHSASSFLQHMTAPAAAKLLAGLPGASAARIFRLLHSDLQESLSKNLSRKIFGRIQQYLSYPSTSVGVLLEPLMEVLPEDITVIDAIHRLERFEAPVSCDLYVADEKYRPVGMIEIGKLMTSDHHVRIHDIMSRRIQPISVYSEAESVLEHPAWVNTRRLPLVDRDNTLVGALRYHKLRESIDETGLKEKHDPIEIVISLSQLYWLSMLQFLDSLLNIAGTKKEEKQ